MSPAAAAASADGTVFTWDASPAAALSPAFTVPAPRCYTLSHLPTLSALRHRVAGIGALAAGPAHSAATSARQRPILGFRASPGVKPSAGVACASARIG